MELYDGSIGVTCVATDHGYFDTMDSGCVVGVLREFRFKVEDADTGLSPTEGRSRWSIDDECVLVTLGKILGGLSISVIVSRSRGLPPLPSR